MEGDAVEVVYKEYEYMRNGKKVIIKRSWTKQIKEPKRVRVIKEWINQHYDKTKSVNANYIKYVNDLSKNNDDNMPTITTFTKYYKQTKDQLPTVQVESADLSALRVPRHSSDSDTNSDADSVKSSQSL